MPMHNPPHPGEVIRAEIIEAIGLTVTDAAKARACRRWKRSWVCSRPMISSGLASVPERSLSAATGHIRRWFRPTERSPGRGTTTGANAPEWKPRGSHTDCGSLRRSGGIRPREWSRRRPQCDRPSTI